MAAREQTEDHLLGEASEEGAATLGRLLAAGCARASDPPAIAGVMIGRLAALVDGGRTPLVVYPGQLGSAALAASSTIDLHGAHVGRRVVLMFECADPHRPIVMGVLRDETGLPLDAPPGQVEVDADGERLVVSASEQLVLRCGEASITLSRAGGVTIRGRHIVSRATGSQRIKGGSVQIN